MNIISHEQQWSCGVLMAAVDTPTYRIVIICSCEVLPSFTARLVGRTDFRGEPIQNHPWRIACTASLIASRITYVIAEMVAPRLPTYLLSRSVQLHERLHQRSGVNLCAELEAVIINEADRPFRSKMSAAARVSPALPPTDVVGGAS